VREVELDMWDVENVRVVFFDALCEGVRLMGLIGAVGGRSTSDASDAYDAW